MLPSVKLVTHEMCLDANTGAFFVACHGQLPGINNRRMLYPCYNRRPLFDPLANRPYTKASIVRPTAVQTSDTDRHTYNNTILACQRIQAGHTAAAATFMCVPGRPYQ